MGFFWTTGVFFGDFLVFVTLVGGFTFGVWTTILGRIVEGGLFHPIEAPPHPGVSSTMVKILLTVVVPTHCSESADKFP
jgi:hypothetical protein